jgi:hypothetical protein
MALALLFSTRLPQSKVTGEIKKDEDETAYVCGRLLQERMIRAR